MVPLDACRAASVWEIWRVNFAPKIQKRKLLVGAAQLREQFQRSSLSSCRRVSPVMAKKMKGIFKGLKIISQMFVHKEHEMEIGYPKDVKHVAHIGLGTSDTSPSWTAEFKGTDDSSAGSVRSTAAQSRQTSWASADFEQPRSMLVPIEIFQDNDRPGMPRGPRKAKKRKTKAKKKNRASSPASSARSSSSRSRASFATAYDAFCESRRGFRVA
ncbi:CRIB domain-containing protein RIC10 [Zea mays]|uniref:CRIB domain-containing protein RIC10 n=2 Tax=Zea mays TaxID=4577 RepID=A0A1D6QSN9_MAIZE|nr:CRIB domain-containing protein RIC10 [Zea mays]